MNRRAHIAQTAFSACLALTGVAALLAMMLQFVYPADTWPAWTAGGLCVAGVLGAMGFSIVAGRSARQNPSSGPLATIRPAESTESRRAA
jgi:hypothetical protein